jgi:hypothetical protein
MEGQKRAWTRTHTRSSQASRVHVTPRVNTYTRQLTRADIHHFTVLIDSDAEEFK